MFDKKLFKSAIIFIMITSFNINSFAAISVSDGSSFVTKSEFSTDLNNMSTRLSQVEKSLDATIDSLVSNYLGKNGIWNGADQTDNIYKAKNITFTFALNGKSSSEAAMNIIKALDINNKLLQSSPKITKTGLMIIAHKFVSNNTECYLWTRGATGRSNENYKTNVYCAIRIKTNTANSQYIERGFLSGLAADCDALHFTTMHYGESYLPESLDGTVKAGYGTVKLIYASDWSAQDLMFVEKDSTLQYEIVATASGNPAYTYIGGQRSGGMNFGTYYVTSVAVY